MSNVKNSGKILIIDDEENILFSLSSLLGREKYVCETANSGEAGIKKFAENKFNYDLVITDLSMPGTDGLQVLKAIKELRPEAYVIILTAYGSSENASIAMKLGAYDYLSKPFENEKMRILVKRIFEKISLDRENVSLKYQLKIQNNLIGGCEKMTAVLEKVAKVSSTDVTVLITGESGTGKELVAQEIHGLSNRKFKNFVTLNCAAIPADLLENELFGREKGAYTGAHCEQKGKFELADGGTLFLDEIGDMPMQIQAKVLRALQEQVIERLGGSEPVKVNVRILAATNKNLEEEIKKKNFREDLYYRLNVINICLPPLRERKSDIAILTKHFVARYSAKIGREEPKVAADALNLLCEYHWPGNVRQLQNTIERILVLADDSVIDRNTIINYGELRDLKITEKKSESGAESAQLIPSEAVSAGSDGCFGIYKVENLESLSFRDAEKALLEMFEFDYLTRALKRNSGNIKKTAEQIGLDRSQLYDKIKYLKIAVDRCKERGV